MTAAERLSSLAEGSDPSLVLKLKSGFAVMSPTQFLQGYCLLLAFPEVQTLNDLPVEMRMTFLMDMAAIGDAVQRATNCARVNYGIYGNLDRFLHAHIVPRYDHEEFPHCVLPPHSYPQEIREDPENQFETMTHGKLLAAIRLHLMDLGERHHSFTHHNPAHDHRHHSI